MAKKTIHINTLINKAMHKPTIKGTDEILYPVLDSYSGKLEGGTGNKSPEFLEKSKSTYNSPTNIRSIVITYEGVTVDYYDTPATADRSGRTRVSSKFNDILHFDKDLKLGSGIHNFQDIGMKMLAYNQDLQKYTMEKQINKDAKAPTEFVVSGNVFGVLSNLYACNNIEEIYLDWTIMLCDAIRPLTCRDSILGDAMLFNYMQGNVPSGMIQDKNGILEALFRRFNGLDKSNVDIKSRFPRLKLIAFVPKLQQLMTTPELMRSRPLLSSITKCDMQEITSRSATLIEVYKDIFTQAGCMVKTFGAINKLNTEFRVKDSQYKFDREKLKSFVSIYTEKVTTAIRNNKYGANGVAGSATANLSEEEQYIKDLLENNPSEANRIITLACVGHSVSEIKELLVSLSKPTRSKVANIIKFDLSMLNK